MRLGQILVDMRACGSDRVRDALEGQVLLGGRLGTNLLELGAVAEEALASALSLQHGRPALHGDIGIDPLLAASLKPEHADRFEVVPYQLSGHRLSLLCRDPADLRKLDEAAFALGKLVAPVVVPEARLWALLRTHYGVARPMRGLALDSAPPAREARAHPQPGPGGPDLMDEAEFEALYTSRVLRPELAPAPLSFADAAAALSGVDDRATVARVVLRYARSRFRRALLLAVHARAADGWEGIGDGLTPQVVARVQLPLGEPGVVQTVVATRSHFLGPLLRTAGNLRLLQALAGGAPKNAFAMPILARGKVVNVLYADGGRGGLVGSEGVGELLILATRISHGYDALLRRVP
jgi:hypothetical protein